MNCTLWLNCANCTAKHVSIYKDAGGRNGWHDVAFQNGRCEVFREDDLFEVCCSMQAVYGLRNLQCNSMLLF